MVEMYEALQQLYYPAPSLAREELELLQKWKYFCWETRADINIQNQQRII